MFKYLKIDIPASIVVFFVALPLCLGIALASGAPLFSGLIAGIVGGIVVGAISGSHIGVSGPAAGLAAIVLSAITDLGSFDLFLVAVVIGGVIQLLLGLLKAGIIGYYFPNSVIRGMLSAIGIIIIMKQVPHFFGYDKNPEGDLGFLQPDGENTFTALGHIFTDISVGPTIAAFISLAILLLWDRVLMKKGKFFQVVQGPIVAVAVGILFYVLTQGTGMEIRNSHLVNVPVPDNFSSFASQFSFPDFSAITNPEIWIIGFTIALVASLETLLCVEATDKLDPEKNVTPTNRELIAQGTGNIISGLIGGLPITQVIVRSSANIQSGAKSKMSAIIHGFLLLISVILLPTILNMIPLSVLAAILIIIGFKLAKPSLFMDMYKQGKKQFIPFIVTIVAIIFTDLLIGVLLGLAVGIVVILLNSYRNSHFLHRKNIENGEDTIKMTFAEEVTFFNKATILKELDNIPENSNLELDVRPTRFLDPDVIEILDDFAIKAKNRNIHVTLISERGAVENPESYVKFFGLRKEVS